MTRIIYTLSITILLSGLVTAQVLEQQDNDPVSIYQPVNVGAPSMASELIEIQAGDDVEGDFHIAPAFEPEGPECWVAHRLTNNITIVDVSNGVIKKTIPTQAFPVDIAFSRDYGLVCCLFGEQVEVWDWRMDTLVTSIPAAGQPARVEVSDDGSTALVSLETTDQALVIDLETFDTHRINNFPTGISGFSFITSNTRNLISYNGFDISSDGRMAVNGTDGPLKIYDLENMTVDSLPEIENASQVRFSDDDSKIVAVVFGSTPAVYQVDVNNRLIAAQIFPDQRVGNFNGHLAMSNDGNRVLLPGNNAGLLIRFDLSDFLTINTGSAVFWTDIQADGQVGVAGGYNTHLVDMNTGIILSTTSGIALNTGAISPSGDFTLAMDPLRRERAEIYFSSNGNILSAGHVQLGSELEADATYSVKFTPDGSKILAVNSLSGTVSIIDVGSKALEAIIPLELYEIFHTAITPDNRYALVGERLADQVSIIDLESLDIKKVLYSGGDRPDQTFVHPSGEKAYVLNAGGVDAIGVIDLSGSDQSFVKSFPSGNTGISWTNRGIRCNLAMTGDGSRGVLATPFDDAIQILDLENDEIMTSIPAEGFALQTALSHPIDGKVYAAVTLKNDSKVFIIEDVLGDPVPFGGLDVGGNPTRIAFDATTDRFAVCSQDERQIDFIDPFNFRVSGSLRFSPHLTPISVQYDSDGTQFVVLQSNESTLPNEFHVDDEVLELGIAPGHYFDIRADGSMAAVASIHEDLVYLIDLTTSSSNMSRIATSPFFSIGPVPAKDHLTFCYLKEGDLPDLSFELISMDGKTLQRGKINSKVHEVDVSSYPEGNFQVIFRQKGMTVQRQGVVIH
ncbi:MAG: hypothetical protein R3275_11145 [Saprospiraceae bacterium]|nr:hypothetical protein [Saprospiraceae bacterium]